MKKDIDGIKAACEKGHMNTTNTTIETAAACQKSGITIMRPSGSVNITRAQLESLGIKINGSEDIRGEMKTFGPWNIPVSYRALVVSSMWDDSKGYTVRNSITLHGVRTMSRPRQSGYCLEGMVSIAGKKHSAFTSSELFELEDGTIISVSTIHARKAKESK